MESGGTTTTYMQPVRFIRIVTQKPLQQEPSEEEGFTLTLVDHDEGVNNQVSTEEQGKGMGLQIISVLENPPTIDGTNKGSDDQIQHIPQVDLDQVNCLFCYAPVKNYDVNKVWKGIRILKKTSQRLFEFIANHLSIDLPKDLMRLTDRQAKATRLLPHNLPLCQKCSVSYYKRVYDNFVEYESALAKLHAEIANCITKTIAASARNNERSVDGGGDFGNVDVSADDMISRFVSTMNEHQVMKEVKRFRLKVVEKNPGGYFEEDLYRDQQAQLSPVAISRDGLEMKCSTTTTDNIQKAVNSSASSIADPKAASSSGNNPTNLNIIKIVKKGPGQFGRELGKAELEKMSTTQILNSCETENWDNDIIDISNPNEPSSNPLNCYAVSNPAPGVIQIIPMKLNADFNPRRKKRCKRREPEYAQQRRNLYTCKFCNEYFPGQAKLNCHLVKVHGMEKPFNCDQCDHRFIDRAALKIHMITHMNESEKELFKKYACHLCPVKYRTKRNLEIHIRSHAGERPFSCDICGKSFTSKTSLKLCQDKHNGIKNEKCPYCQQTFLRREVLKIHVRTHTGERPFKCHKCGKAFAQRTPLRIHLRVHEKLGASYIPRPPRTLKNKDKE